MGILLVLTVGYLCRAYLFPESSGGSGPPPPPPQLPPLAGKNTISQLGVNQNTAGVWMADFDYFYTSEPPFGTLQIELTTQPDPAKTPAAPERRYTILGRALRGAHHMSVAIDYPGSQARTGQVEVKLRSFVAGNEETASQQIDKIIDWPDFPTWTRERELAQNSPEENLKHAVALIDSDAQPQLSQAKIILERLIGQNPQLDAGYVELARIAMKSNWGPEGVHQAESLLASALHIRPHSADAKILLGYVYAHQARFAQAEALFADAAKSSTRNLWLWANWGEVLGMQGKFDQAIGKYREAIAHPMTHDTYDRARADAYEHLLALLERRKEFDGMEALYKQRIAEFGPGSCYSSGYARFLLQVRGDARAAIDVANGALHQNCDDSEARQILGLAEYVKWANATGPQRTASLNQARIFLPAGPMPLYLLAISDRTTSAAKQLIAAGEQIDQRDNDRLTALAYALQNHDLAAAKRLLALGAHGDAPVGYGDVPVALLPVMEGSIEAVRLMQQFGVDYYKLRYRGATAFDFAKQSGNSALLEVLEKNRPAL
jgi:tetratricopeptide (TPR) repeat protein